MGFGRRFVAFALDSKINPMSDAPIQIRGEPFSNARCKFIVDRPVYEQAAFYFPNAEKAAGSPLAEALFAIEGVSAVLIAHNEVTVNKNTLAEWPVVGKQVGAAIRAHLASGQPAVKDELRQQLPPPDEIRVKVAQVLEHQINPFVAQHGGVVRLVDVQENNVLLQMGGGCQGCGSATATLRFGVETAIRAAVPEVGAILDVTDHSAGTNPYYAAGKA